MSFLLTFLFAARAFAYIPEYSLITSHAADQHGKGGYWIEQEVTFHRGAESFSVKESWIVLNENSMRVTLEGRGPLKGMVKGTMIYEGSQKSFVDDSAPGVRNQRLGDEWLEPLFHFRSSRYVRSRLVNLKIAPPESLRDRPPLNSEGEPVYTAPDFIRLSRVGGDTAWAVGLPEKPTAWFEQDQFVLRKLRGARVLLKADDYAKFDDGLWYPRKQSYTFGNFTVEVQTLAVRALGKLKADDVRFRSSLLTPAHDGLKLPDAEPLKEFYSRFR